MTQLVSSRAVFSFVWMQSLCSSFSDILPRLQCTVLRGSFPSKRTLGMQSSLPSPSHVQWHSFQPPSPSVLRYLKPDFKNYSLPSGWLKESKSSFHFFKTYLWGAESRWVLLELWWWYSRLFLRICGGQTRKQTTICEMRSGDITNTKTVLQNQCIPRASRPRMLKWWPLLCKTFHDLPLLGGHELLPPGFQRLSLRPLFCSAHSVRSSGLWGVCRHLPFSRLRTPWAEHSGSRLAQASPVSVWVSRGKGSQGTWAGSRQEGGDFAGLCLGTQDGSDASLGRALKIQMVS